MRYLDTRGITGLCLLAVGAIALVAGIGPQHSFAADPDRRHVVIRDHDRDFDADELARQIEESLEGLESLGPGLEDLGDDIAGMVQEAFENGAVIVDRDWPDHVRFYGPDHGVSVDTRELAREMEDLARRIQRDVIREVERGMGDHEGRVRVWNVRGAERDRESIQDEMRELERQMRRLQRELDRLEEEGDI